jgi:hypothetical protein
VDLLFGAAWTCDLVGCRLLIAVWAWFFLGCYSGGLLVVVWTWACGSTSLVTVWWNWTCCPTRSGGPVTPLSSFIISDFFFFFLISSCLLESLLGSLFLEKIMLLGNSSLNCLLWETSCVAILTIVIQLLRRLRIWLSGWSRMHV